MAEAGNIGRRTRADISGRRASRRVFEVAEALATAGDLASVMEIVRRAARELTGADGVTFVLREGELVHYADEDAIAPLWKGRRFPLRACISGFAIEHRATVAIDDVYLDERIPHDLYRPTFVRSLVMVPVRVADPQGAIGAYWAEPRRATDDEIAVLEALASVTALALANAALQAELRESTRARDEFLAIASHELRTPLTAMKLQVYMLERMARDGAHATLAGVHERLSRYAGRLETLVDDMLDVSLYARGELRLERSVIDLAECVRAEVARFADGAESARSPIVLDAPSIVVGEWDGKRLSQVVAALLANALRYGEGKPIDVEVGGDRGSAHLRVRDRGTSATTEARARSLQRFGRTAPAPRDGEPGLGLFIARCVVEAHGGRFELESRPGDGTTFTVVLPRAADALA